MNLSKALVRVSRGRGRGRLPGLYGFLALDRACITISQPESGVAIEWGYHTGNPTRWIEKRSPATFETVHYLSQASVSVVLVLELDVVYILVARVPIVLFLGKAGVLSELSDGLHVGVLPADGAEGAACWLVPHQLVTGTPDCPLQPTQRVPLVQRTTTVRQPPLLNLPPPCPGRHTSDTETLLSEFRAR